MGERRKSSINPESLEFLSSTIKARVDRLIELGFHQEKYPKNNSREAEILYRHDFILPKKVLLPEGHDLFPEVILVDRRIDLTSLLRLGEYITSGVALKNDIDNLKNEKPYIIFTGYLKKFSGLIPEDAIKKFTPNETGLSLTELAYYYRQVPGFFADKGVYAVGSRKSGDFPYLVKYLKFPEIHVASVGYSQEYNVVVSRLQQTIVLG